MKDDKYSGMTVNERLYISGYMDEFDQAIENRNVEKVKAILNEIELDDDSIKAILEKYNLD